MESRKEQNRAHFDTQAASYDTKHEKATEEIARRINTKLDFLRVDWADDASSEEGDGRADEKPQRQVRLLDYACGTGSMSRVSLPHMGRTAAKITRLVSSAFPTLLWSNLLPSVTRSLRPTPHNASALTCPRRWWRPTLLEPGTK